MPKRDNQNTGAQSNSGNRRRSHRRVFIPLVFLLIVAAFLFAPFTTGIRSLAAASVYDYLCEEQCLPHKLGIKLEMPLHNTNFLPLMLTYNDDAGMSAWLQKPVRFTVDYTAGGFDFLSGHSRFYDNGNPLYNAYTGAYYLQGLGKPADKDTILNVAAFDQRCLALPAIGLNADQAVFEANNIRELSKVVEIAGYNWQRYDASITTNGPEHTKKSFHTGYILFGDPPPADAEYPLRSMAGRMYTTYLEDTDLTIGLYIIAKNEDTIEELDRQMLSKTIISNSKK